MHARPALPGGPYLVVGLARSGVAIARTLTAHGEVIGADRAEAAGAAGLEGVEVHLGSEGTELLDRVRTVVKSPGVPREAAVVGEALRRGMEVTGELELAWRMLPNRFIAVTGTNGKTTTVELLGEIYRAAGIPVAVAGNVGTPLASLVGSIEPETVVVCEASSFQLEDTSAFAPECAVLLNLEDDHLDRHGTREAYTAAKRRIFANQAPDGISIMPEQLSADPFDLGELRLRGGHNRENARAAALAADGMGVPRAAIRDALASFAGVAHRLEEVTRVGGVLYVNDSKATNPASAIRGVEAFERGVHAILGGSLKGGGFETLRPAVAQRCSAVYLIGAAAQRIASDLGRTVPIVPCGTLERAVAAAHAAAEPGDVVLLSPACASFDQFRDYEHRGQRFREIAGALG